MGSTYSAESMAFNLGLGFTSQSQNWTERRRSETPQGSFLEGLEITEVWTRGQAELTALLLREPHNAARFMPAVTEGWFAESNKIGREIVRQFRDKGKYSVFTVAAALQMPVGEIQFWISANFPNTDSDLFFDFFAVLHGQYGELQVATKTFELAQKGKTAPEIWAAQDEVRTKIVGAGRRLGDNGQTFDQFIDNLLSGNVPDFPNKTFLRDLRRYYFPYWEPGQVTVVGARPGVGKTAFLSGEVLRACRAGLRCVVFSKEFTERKFRLRLLEMQLGASLTETAKAPGGLAKIEAARREQKGFDLVVVHEFGTVEEAIVAVRQLHYEKPITGLVGFDYAQILSSAKRGENQTVRIGNVSGALMDGARTLDIPFILLSQLSRKAAERADYRPSLADLRDSGALEQDARNVILLYRPEVHGLEKIEDPDQNEVFTEGYAELLIEKNSITGTLGWLACRFDKFRGYYSEGEDFYFPTAV
jgi:hypothetical protein